MRRRGFLAALPAIAAVGAVTRQEPLAEGCWLDEVGAPIYDAHNVTIELADDGKQVEIRPVSPVQRFMQAVKRGEGGEWDVTPSQVYCRKEPVMKGKKTKKRKSCGGGRW